MRAFDLIAERRILDALSAGELDDLPGRGKPLALEDVTMVPEALRAAYRVLSNAGLAPPAVHLRSDIAELERQLEASGAAAGRLEARRRLALLHAQLDAQRRRVSRRRGGRDRSSCRWQAAETA